jgi:hypothetical protein
VPTVVLHFSVSWLGHFAGEVKSLTFPSRLGPRHWGQSAARTQLAQSTITQTAITAFDRFIVFIMASSSILADKPALRPPAAG